MKIKLTPFGAGLTSSVIFIFLTSIFIKDLFLLILGLALMIMIIIDYFVTIYLERRCFFETYVGSDRIWVWESGRIEIISRSCLLEHDIKIVKPLTLKMIEKIDRDSHRIVLDVRFEYSGTYKIEVLNMIIYSFLKIFQIHRHVAVNKTFIVYPEYVYWLGRIAYALSGEGLEGASSSHSGGSLEMLSIKSLLRTVAGEYYETREYVPGDELRRIDWKATARALKMMIKDLRELGGEGVMFAYDPRCSGSYTCDSIVSTLFSVALTIYQEKISPLYVYNIYEKKIYRYKDPERFLISLAEDVIMKIIMNKLSKDLYEYVSPSEFKKLLSLIESSLKETEYIRMKDLDEKLFTLLRGALIVSDVLNGSSYIIDLVNMMKDSSFEKIAIVPEKPWIDLDNLEDKYLGYKTYSYVINDLKRSGFKIYVKKKGGFEIL